MTDDQEIEAAVKRFPKEFGLKGFPGKRFTIERSACYIGFGKVTLYVYVKTETGWLAFCKGFELELQREITP